MPDHHGPGWTTLALVIVAVLALLVSAVEAQGKEVVCGLGSIDSGDRGAECRLVSHREGRRVQEGDAGHEALTLAAMCWGESESSIEDCIAQLFVIRKRAAQAGVTTVAMARQYSSPLRRKARRLQALRWGDVPGWPAHRNEQWRRIRTIVVWFRAGLLEDPCPRARHFGSPEDGKRGSMRRVCAGLDTVQVYYSVGGAR